MSWFFRILRYRVFQIIFFHFLHSFNLLRRIAKCIGTIFSLDFSDTFGFDLERKLTFVRLRHFWIKFLDFIRYSYYKNLHKLSLPYHLALSPNENLSLVVKRTGLTKISYVHWTPIHVVIAKNRKYKIPAVVAGVTV